MISDAIGLERVSRVIGWNIKKGNFQENNPNLPQSVAIFGEASTAHQSDITPDVGVTITSAKQAGELFGYGSPIHMAMRILRAISGDGMGGIPTIVYPQAEAGGSTAKEIEVTVSGVATGNTTHYLVIGGRKNVDGQVYALNIQEGDTAADVYDKISDAVNGVLGSPMLAQNTQYEATLTSKWKGLTANGLTVTVDVGDDAAGLEYTSTSTQAGSGTPSIADALAAMGNVWHTKVLNSYGAVSTTMDALEAFNGIAKDVNPTGRYAGTTWKPFIAFTGTVVDDPSSITDPRDEEMTIAMCPAPNCANLHFEVAASYVLLQTPLDQNTPHLDIAGQYLPDILAPEDIGSMSEYNNRDLFVKRGCSTVDLVSGKYQVQDFVTTYHPDGEANPSFRYCRDLGGIDMNVRYKHMLTELINVQDHAIANDGDTVTAQKVVKPKQWKACIAALANELATLGLITDPAFMIASIQVGISTTNPNRFETYYKYKRSGFVRQSATTAEAGFNYGTINA